MRPRQLEKGKRANADGEHDMVQRLKEIRNILSFRGRKLVPEARDISHYADVLKGIWWYELPTGDMMYSAESKSHLDEAFAETVSPFSGRWVRGRVGDDRGKVYAFLYKCDFKARVIPGAVAGEMFRRLREKSGLPIRYFVDEYGYSLA
jgi:hypothetical protein